MQAVIALLLPLLTKIAPGASTAVIEEVINILSALIPILISEYQALMPIVQNVITALQQSGDITPEQWDALDAMSAQYDADFKTALDAAMAQDSAAVAAKPAT
jgi:hypothetical protein